jgi:hypothetical protein
MINNIYIKPWLISLFDRKIKWSVLTDVYRCVISEKNTRKGKKTIVVWTQCNIHEKEKKL